MYPTKPPNKGTPGIFGSGLGRARQRAAQHVQEFLPGFCGRGEWTPPMFTPVGLDANLETIAEADEGVARQPLAALDAFQQESRTKRRELQIRGDRRVQIGCNVKRSVSLQLANK